MALTSVTVTASYPSAHELVLDNTRGHVMKGAVSPSGEGFNPLELQAASLLSCVAISLRIVAKQMGLAPLKEIDLDVQATKAPDSPSRLEQFVVQVRFHDDLSPEVISKLVSGAEEICTISNTLKATQVHIECHAR